MDGNLAEMVIYVAIMVVLGIFSMLKQRAEKAKAEERAQRYGQSRADGGARAPASASSSSGSGGRSDRARRRKEEYEAWRERREAKQAPGEAQPDREERTVELRDVFEEVATQAAATPSRAQIRTPRKPARSSVRPPRTPTLATDRTPTLAQDRTPTMGQDPDEGESFWHQDSRADYLTREHEFEEHVLLTKNDFHQEHERALGLRPDSPAAHVLHRAGEARHGLLPTRILQRLTPLQAAVVHSFILERPSRKRR